MVNDLFFIYLILYEKINGCYGAKYLTLYCMEKHQGVRTFDTNAKTSPKYILKYVINVECSAPCGRFD